MVILNAYARSAAARIEFREGKVWLTIAPVAANGDKRYDWEKKKNFNLDRSELHAIKLVMETALRRGVPEAQELVKTLFGQDKKNCLFTHVTKSGQALGGLELFEDKGTIYTPFSFRITYYSKAQQGREDTIRVGMTRINALMIIKDIDTFNQAYMQDAVRQEIARSVVNNGKDTRNDFPEGDMAP